MDFVCEEFSYWKDIHFTIPQEYQKIIYETIKSRQNDFSFELKLVSDDIKESKYIQFGFAFYDVIYNNDEPGF